MSVLKCQMCGGTLEIEDNGAFAVCAYCGTRQALPESGASTPESATADALRIENEKRKAEEANRGRTPALAEPWNIRNMLFRIGGTYRRRLLSPTYGSH